MIEGERVDLLRTFGRTAVRRWRYEKTHDIRIATMIVGRMPDGDPRWFVDAHKLGLSHTYPDEATALDAAAEARDAYAGQQTLEPYGGKGPLMHEPGEWVEHPPSVSPRISYGKRPRERFEP
jgi:hypothetical protein